MPRLRGVLALGGTAHNAVLRAHGLRPARMPFRHGTIHTLSEATPARRQLSCVAAEHEHRPADRGHVSRGGSGVAWTGWRRTTADGRATCQSDRNLRMAPLDAGAPILLRCVGFSCHCDPGECQANAGGSNLHLVMHCDEDCRVASLLAMTGNPNCPPSPDCPGPRMPLVTATPDIEYYCEYMRREKGSKRPPLTGEQRRQRRPVHVSVLLTHPVSGRRVRPRSGERRTAARAARSCDAG